MKPKKETDTRECAHHGTTEFGRRGLKYWKCRKCQVEAVTRRRRRVRALLVEEAGGCCKLCGYAKCIAALEFHHVDQNKEFGLSTRGITSSMARMRAEAAKCILVCANCHREIHAELR